MKRTIKLSVIGIIGLFSLIGCVPPQKIVANIDEVIGPPPYSSLSVMYTKSFFQERFMTKSILLDFVFAPSFSQAVWDASGNYEDATGLRLESSKFEQLLGDFDVSDHFFQELNSHIHSNNKFVFTFTEDYDTTEKLLKFIRCNYPSNCSPADSTIQAKFPCGTALKLAYGLGARQGSEQFGFIKTYRPFIRLIGVTKLFSHNQVIWEEDILVFGKKGYKGNKASADLIDRDELIVSFKYLTSQAIDLLMESLDGNELREMPILVDTNRADLTF
ncbi:MAG: hypothetical protein KQI78_25625 [Deltaproteobacteria bacterium]|jgi:hypothetical protein|nr:hypothetical protein [Deltaproteobacteria bacterium]